MLSLRNTLLAAALAPLALVGAPRVAAAQSDAYASSASGESAPPVEVSVLGGLQFLNENDTALPDLFLNVPLVAAVSYHLTPTWALEGEFTWLIPVQRSVDLGPGPDVDRKTPDILAYQAGVRASFPLASWRPYLAGGLGAVTFLSNTDSDRLPQLSDSQTAFAINFGGGAAYGLGSHWALRADLRELVAFPSSDAQGLSSAGNADPIWMERVSVGVDYRF